MNLSYRMTASKRPHIRYSLMRHLVIFVVFTLGLLILPGCFDSASDAVDSYPGKPIKVVVPFPAGGGSDSFVRIIQKAVRDEQLLAQPLVVINVPGAGGTIGSRRARQATADGHTILCLHEGILSSKYAGRTTYGPEAFRAIAATGQSNLVVCVLEDSPFSNLSELMATAGSQPEKIRFGMAQGTPTHFVGRKLETARKENAGKFRYVASGGGTKRFNDLIGGHIDVTPFSLAEYSNFRENGVRAIAYLGAARLPEAPEIPTAREQGFDVIMRHVQYWWAPKSTPNAAIDMIADVLEAAMATGYVQNKLEELKIQPLFLRDKALRNHLANRETDFQDVALVTFDGLPNLVPWTLALTFLMVLLAVWTSFQRKAPSPAHASKSAWTTLTFCVGALVAYVLAMQIFGLPYAFATAAFIPLMGRAAGARSWRTTTRLVVTGIGLGWACSLIFTKLLVIDLP